MFGINITYRYWQDSPLNQRQLERRYQEYFDRIEEAGVSSIRVPLAWELLQAVDETVSTISDNAKEIDRFQQLLQAVPSSISVLGVLLAPSEQIAAAYFEDQSIMPDLIDNYARSCVKNFTNINEWEIWNEPNASDFYLSIQNKEKPTAPEGLAHRPWTPDEFIDHILVPGHNAIRSLQPTARICIGGFAENGLVGHDDRPPALCNRLPRDERFRQIREQQGPHGHFYFEPDFAEHFMHALDQRKKIGQSIKFDAWGLHPYPYFQIHQANDNSLVERTGSLVDSVISISKRSSLAELECWVTEIGARSNDMASNNEYSETQQEEYYSKTPARVGYDKTIKRLYWYKLVDTLRDMQMEKTFGLLDNQAVPKRAFWALKHMSNASTNRPARQFLYDDFWYGIKFSEHAFDPHFWEISSDTNFRFCTPLKDKRGNLPSVLISPGRWAGNWMTLTTKPAIHVGDEQTLQVSVRFKFQAPATPSCWSLTGLSNNISTDWCNIINENNHNFRIELPFCKRVISISHTDFPFATAEHFTGLDLEFDQTDTVVVLHFNELKIYRVINTIAGIRPGNYQIQQKFQKTAAGKPFFSLRNFKARSGKPQKWSEKYPAELAFPADTWTVHTNSHAQIDQEDWVMRMMRYRHNGYFVEIGGDDGIGNSNSYLLEKDFGWQGIMVEANPRLYKKVCRNRSCIAVNYAAYKTSGEHLEFVDAGAVGGLVDELQDDIHQGLRSQNIDAGKTLKVPTLRGDDIFMQYSAPELIDYLSVDTEGSELSVLQSIDFSSWKICLITVEHAGNQEKREQVMSYLEPFGYERIRIWFEDWFFHPCHIAENLGLSIEAAREHIIKVNSTIPYIRRSTILNQAESAYRDQNIELATDQFKEVLKNYYPDNIQAYVRTAVILASQGRAGQSLALLDKVIKQRPNHPGALRQLVLIATQANQMDIAKKAYNRLEENASDILLEPLIIKAATLFPDTS